MFALREEMSKKECMSEEESEKGGAWETNCYALAPTFNSAHELTEET